MPTKKKSTKGCTGCANNCDAQVDLVLCSLTKEYVRTRLFCKNRKEEIPYREIVIHKSHTGKQVERVRTKMHEERKRILRERNRNTADEYMRKFGDTVTIEQIADYRRKTDNAAVRHLLGMVATGTITRIDKETFRLTNGEVQKKAV